jgi:hypothetical protein
LEGKNMTIIRAIWGTIWIWMMVADTYVKGTMEGKNMSTNRAIRIIWMWMMMVDTYMEEAIEILQIL